MLSSTKLTLTALLAGSSVVSASPNWWPSWWPTYGQPTPSGYNTPTIPSYHTPTPPSYHTPTPPSYHTPTPPPYHTPTPPGYTSKCTTSYSTETLVSSKPYTTVSQDVESSLIQFTTKIPGSTVVFVTYKTTELSTVHTSKTQLIPYTTTKTSTKTVDTFYPCTKTSTSTSEQINTVFVTKVHKASETLTLTKQSKTTSLSSGVNTKVGKSLIPTFKLSTSTSLSSFTTQSLSNIQFTTVSLRTRTFTSVWTEVDSVTQTLKTTITKNVVQTSTLTAINSIATTLTSKYTTAVPFTKTQTIVVTYTTSVFKPTKGYITLTEYKTTTLKIPQPYPTTCVTATQVLTYLSGVTQSKSVSFFDVTRTLPVKTSSAVTKATFSPSIGSSLSIWTNFKTSVGFSPFTTYKTDANVVCTTLPTPPGYSPPGYSPPKYHTWR